ncbi:mitochondrial folate transporter-like protein/carrier [Lindgomyces ingoldianus]|uniref:Mitochondrial folate transporter-like protein/carrier n=1 Tax=Lindgomyces ingoldianus TaxID=673940 RepID=A0ACB6QJK7_9PLEO|nr:mitochondrial folate transporter-like protein/carrier [Lindgomyces ingoldianus]KAF2467118.1 mitochondrial folate transporter-like protein/carrier [Lindgomyces ingoldianus]
MSAEGTDAPPSPSTTRERYAPTTARLPSRDAPPQNAHVGSRLSSLAVRCASLPNSSVNAFCGASAGIASGIVTCPLDVIKTRLQAQGSFRPRNLARPSRMVYNGLVGTARVIWLEDGVRGMYRGLGPMLLGYIPTWAVYMSVYDFSKDFFYQRIEDKWLSRVSASITAGACSTLATNPIWVIKTRLMSQVSSRASEEHRPPWQYKGTLDAFRKMYHNEGLAAFYSGLAPALLGLTHVAIQFPLYEYFKMKFTGLEMGQTINQDENVHWVGILGATILSKICATSATYPHEVLRTRLQTQQRSLPSQSHEEISFRGGHPGYGHHTRPPGTASSDGMINIPRYRGVIRTCRTILHEEGWRAFYNGMGTNMVRAVPAAVTTMLTYESLRSWHQRLKFEGEEIERQSRIDG